MLRGGGSTIVASSWAHQQDTFLSYRLETSAYIIYASSPAAAAYNYSMTMLYSCVYTFACAARQYYCVSLPSLAQSYCVPLQVCSGRRQPQAHML